MSEAPPSRRKSDPAAVHQARQQRLQRGLVAAALVVGVPAAIALVIWQINRHVVHESWPNWSPDSREIVFSAYEDDAVDLFVMHANGTGRRRLTDSSAEERSPAFSPDGRWIAYEMNQDGNAELYLISTEGTQVRRLTRNGGTDRQPAWSPDGRITFVSDRDRAPSFDLFVMDSTGGEASSLTTAGSYSAPAPSPDGRSVAVEVGGQIALVDMETRRVSTLTNPPFGGASPTWSPEGRRIAFVSQRNGRWELFAVDVNGNNEERLASLPAGHAALPRWSPDGTRIAFVLYGGDGPDEGAFDRSAAIYVLEVGSGRLVRLSR